MVRPCFVPFMVSVIPGIPGGSWVLSLVRVIVSTNSRILPFYCLGKIGIIWAAPGCSFLEVSRLQNLNSVLLSGRLFFMRPICPIFRHFLDSSKRFSSLCPRFNFLWALVLPSCFVFGSFTASFTLQLFFAFPLRFSTGFRPCSSQKNYAPGSPGSGSVFLGVLLHVPGGRVRKNCR